MLILPLIFLTAVKKIIRFDILIIYKLIFEYELHKYRKLKLVEIQQQIKYRNDRLKHSQIPAVQPKK